MKNYQRKRPQLPEHTPFLPQSKFAVQTPWHGDSVRTATAPRPPSTEDHLGSASASLTGTENQLPPMAVGPNGSVISGLPLPQSVVSSSSSSRPSSTLLMQRRAAPRLQTGEMYIPPNVSRATTPGLPKLHGFVGDLHEGSMQSFVGSSAQISLIEDSLVDVEISRRRADVEEVREAMKIIQVRRVENSNATRLGCGPFFLIPKHFPARAGAHENHGDIHRTGARSDREGGDGAVRAATQHLPPVVRQHVAHQDHGGAGAQARERRRAHGPAVAVPASAAA
jgi:hypothetical protein